MQLLQPLINIRQILVTFAAYDGSDVIPQSNKERIFIAECLIDGFDYNLLNGALQYRASIAEQASVLQSADAAPDYGFFATVVPMDSAKNLTAFTADDYLSKDVVAAKGSGLSVLSGTK